MFYKFPKRNDQVIIRFLDVCSLYPFICKYGIFPIGHPAIFFGPCQMPKPDKFLKIVGFAKILILPPKQIRLPVLGVKVNEDKEAYIKEMKVRENIDLEKNQIKSNPGLCSLLNMCFNSLW